MRGTMAGESVRAFAWRRRVYKVSENIFATLIWWLWIRPGKQGGSGGGVKLKGVS